MSTLPATTKPKNKLLSMIRDKHPGFHPALILAELALDEDKSIQLKAAKALLPYIEPQLKSIEVISDKKEDFGVLRVSVKNASDSPKVIETVAEDASEIDITPSKPSVKEPTKDKTGLIDKVIDKVFGN